MRFALLLLAVVAGGACGLTWTETTQPDFADGNVDAQMYVSHRSRLEPDSGCVEFFSRFDVDNNGFYDLACSDDSGPRLTLYLGSDSGYVAGSRLDYDIAAGGNVDLADLNLDGWAELIHSGWRMGQATIYWGTPGGPSSTDTTVLDLGGEGEDVNVYDLDRDGYLDIVVGSDDGNLYIFWGSRAGYSSANRGTVSLGHAIGHNTEIADFDKDGWGDIAVSMWTFNECPIVYWGPGRQPRDIVMLPFRWNNAHGITVADFNRDEWLDIVYTGYDTVLSSFVYFGSDSGFRANGFTAIQPGKCYGGSAAADWNGDGWLDIVYMRGNWTQGGRWKPSVYLNTGAAPYFSNANRIELGTDTLNASGGFIADLDFDGSIDIFVNNMLPNSSSYVMWGPTHVARTALPVNNDHHGVFREPGGSYDRAKTAQYYSSVFDVGADSTVLGGTASWVAFEPPGSRVAVAYRSGNTAIPDTSWTSFVTVAVNGGDLPAQILGRRFVQYRARFSYDRPCFLPDLEEINTAMTVTLPRFHDVGVVRVLEPSGTVDSGTVVLPSALVRNHGDQPATFEVRFRIGALYSDSAVISLSPGEEDTARLAAWVAEPVGSYLVVANTVWPPDEAPENDTARASVDVVRLPVFDVGPTAILAPGGTVDSGTTVVPKVVVQNFGNQFVAFPLTLAIDTGYSMTITDSLIPGAVDTVSFAPWTAGIAGVMPVVTWTGLAGDQDQSNDTLRSQVDVVRPPDSDVGPTVILAPTGYVDSGATVTPRVVVRNFGNQPAIFPVTLLIGADYSYTALDTLDPGASDTVTFVDWPALAPGDFVVTCFTALAQDQDRANDTARAQVTVARRPSPDVGPTVILAPAGNVDSGTQVLPRVVVRNFGNEDAAFPVTLEIGTGYSVVTGDTLAAGASDTVDFPAWTATPLGRQTITCYTALALDRDPLNDTIRSQVTVVQRPQRDVGPIAILAPVGIVDSGTRHTPSAVVRNFGNQPAIFEVTMAIDTGFRQSLWDTLDPGADDTVRFAQWTAPPAGTVPLVCNTRMMFDERPENDTIRDSVRVRPPPVHDVGVAAILAPAVSHVNGDTVVPRVVVCNFGNAVESYFDVRCRIGSGYDEQAAVVAPLQPGTTAEVAFAPWVAQSGDYVVSCSTRLVNDANRANDRATRTVHVAPAAGLAIDPDITDRIQVGFRQTYAFHALLQSEQFDAVSLEASAAPAGWAAWLVDSTGQQPINGLDVVLPGIEAGFRLHVSAPAAGLPGVIESLPAAVFVIRGALASDPAVRDSAVLTLSLLPNLEVHNFPNPVKDRTTFVIGLPAAGNVTLTVYNRAGERVRRLLDRVELEPRIHFFDWDAANDQGRRVARGSYQYIFEYVRADKTERIIRKLVVARE